MKRFAITLTIAITICVVICVAFVAPAWKKQVIEEKALSLSYATVYNKQTEETDTYWIDGFCRLGFNKIKLYVIDAQGNKQEPIVVDIESVRINYYEFD